MHKNFEFLNSFGAITPETFSKLQNIAKFRSFDGAVPIAEFGKVPSKIYLLLSGVMRCYITSDSGKEHNKSFFFPMSFVGSLTALIKEAPSEVVYETISPCKVYEIDFYKLKALCAEDIEINNLYSKILEQVFMLYEKRQLELISLDATQRYQRLKKDIPNIDSLVPQYHIASYLSITAVQLSRIRKKLKDT